MAQIKEFKTTCLSCNTIKNFPFMEFNEDYFKNQKNNASKNLACATITTMGCPLFGCGLIGDQLLNKKSYTIDRSKSKAEQVKDYCRAHICSKCFSRGIKIEVVTHEI